MKLTKILAVVLAALMAVMCFAACTATVVDDSASGADLEENNAVVEETPAEDAAPVEEAEPEAEVLTMATNAYFKPYEYYEGDKIVGIDAEIAEAIAQKLGKQLVINDMQFDSILTAVQTGSVDFGMAGMTVTDERLESVNFSTAYITNTQVVIVKDSSGITSLDDLKADGSMKYGVQQDTTAHIYAADTVEKRRLWR